MDIELLTWSFELLVHNTRSLYSSINKYKSNKISDGSIVAKTCILTFMNLVNTQGVKWFLYSLPIYLDLSSLGRLQILVSFPSTRLQAYL